MSVLHGTPWWVYLLFIFLTILGWKGRHPRVISLYRVFVIPFIFSFWSLHILYVRYTFTWTRLEIWILGLIVGALIGWSTFHHPILAADKRRKLIKLRGTWVVLILIWTIFLLRYYFDYFSDIRPSDLKNPTFIYSDLAATSFIIGLFLGKALKIHRAYRALHHTDLQRS